MRTLIRFIILFYRYNSNSNFLKLIYRNTNFNAHILILFVKNGLYIYLANRFKKFHNIRVHHCDALHDALDYLIFG